MAQSFAVFFTIVFALSYAAGTQYLTGYYDYFGIHLVELGLPLEHIAGSAIVPIFSISEKVIGVVVAAVAIYALYLFDKGAGNIITGLLWVSGGSLVLILVTSVFSAYDSGRVAAKKSLATMPSYYVDISNIDGTNIRKPGKVKFEEPFSDVPALGRLIISTKDAYYIYGDNGSEKDRWIFRIPREAVYTSGAYFQ
ncbi:MULTISPECIES: hypothetical protein [Marinovum]|uniref:hypothetical protein n=1 Tax=Marinovum TaxID=367771 RepID=UPI00237AA6B8|nr:MULTISPECIES: hypothetical protein [Marinovum]MDD9742793.1 hypothetical protein [Marinovum sp. PR37]